MAFPEDIEIPFEEIERLWGQTGGLDDIDTKEALKAMHYHSLFQRFDVNR